MKRIVSQILKEPLAHFLAAALLVFGFYRLVSPDRGQDGASMREAVNVGEGELRWLSRTFAEQQRRPPSAAELHRMVEDFVEEQLLAREAIALGLDKDDTMIRRRLAQKLTFLMEGISQADEPAEGELLSYYLANAASFETPASVSFDQIFFGDGSRKDPKQDAESALRELQSVNPPAADTLGDTLIVGARFDDMSETQVRGAFGDDFAQAVVGLETNRWIGPIRSAYGLHLVRLRENRARHVPSFEAAQARVRESYRRRRESELKASFLGKLRDKYGVTYAPAAKAFALAPTEQGATR